MTVLWWFKKYKKDIVYSVFSTGLEITGIDEIVCAKDGIYIFDEEKLDGDIMFNFEEAGTSRFLRLDKIFCDIDMFSAKVICDNKSYEYRGNRWISCGRGIDTKKLKVVIRDINSVGFLSFRLALLKRAKE